MGIDKKFFKDEVASTFKAEGRKKSSPVITPLKLISFYASTTFYVACTLLSLLAFAAELLMYKEKEKGKIHLKNVVAK